MKPNLSILICTYKRPEHLRALMRDLNTASANMPFICEGIVVDNDKDASAAPIVRAEANMTNISWRYAKESQQGVSSARNRALRESSGVWRLFLDDDQRVAPDFVAELWQSLQSVASERGALCLEKRFVFGEQCLHAATVLKGKTQVHLTPLERRCMGTGGFLLHEDALRKIDKGAIFDRRLDQCGGEDIDFYLRLKASGVCMRYAALPHVIEQRPEADTHSQARARRAMQSGYADTRIEHLHRSQAALRARLSWLARDLAYFLLTAILGGGERWWRQIGKLRAHLGIPLQRYGADQAARVTVVTRDLAAGGAESMIRRLVSATHAPNIRTQLFLYDVAESDSVNVEELAEHVQVTRHRKRGRFDPSLWWHLLMHCRWEGIRILHTQDVGSLLYAVLARPFVPTLKIVHTVHTLHTIVAHPRHRLLMRWLLPRADRVTTVSSAAAHSMGQHGLQGRRPTLVIPNGVDAVALQDCGSFSHLPGQPLAMGTLCRISPEKGLDRSLALLHQLRRRGVRFSFTHAGSGDAALQQEYRRSAEKLDIASDMRWLGYQTDITPVLSGLQIYLSLSREECHPVSVVEAMMAGKLCVLSDIAPHRELAGAGGAILVGEDLASAATVLSTIGQHPENFRATAMRGQEIARGQFDLARVIQRYDDLYQESEAGTCKTWQPHLHQEQLFCHQL